VAPSEQDPTKNKDEELRKKNAGKPKKNEKEKVFALGVN